MNKFLILLLSTLAMETLDHHFNNDSQEQCGCGLSILATEKLQACLGLSSKAAGSVSDESLSSSCSASPGFVRKWILVNLSHSMSLAPLCF